MLEWKYIIHRWKYSCNIIDNMSCLYIIKECICKNSMSVLVNDSPTEDFRVINGLCQGDPLESFLLLIVEEGLKILTNGETKSRRLNGFKFQQTLQFRIPQFKDETIFLAEKSLENLWSLKIILRRFEFISSLKVNSSRAT